MIECLLLALLDKYISHAPAAWALIAFATTSLGRPNHGEILAVECELAKCRKGQWETEWILFSKKVMNSNRVRRGSFGILWCEFQSDEDSHCLKTVRDYFSYIQSIDLVGSTCVQSQPLELSWSRPSAVPTEDIGTTYNGGFLSR